MTDERSRILASLSPAELSIARDLGLSLSPLQLQRSHAFDNGQPQSIEWGPTRRDAADELKRLHNRKLQREWKKRQAILRKAS